MKLIVDIPNSLYANLAKIDNGSIASKRIIECVKHGKPYKVDVLDKIRAEIKAYQSDAFYSDNVMINKRVVLEIIDKYIEDLPPVKPHEPKWIPVSKKPNKNGGYLCSVRFMDNHTGICIADYVDDLYKVDEFDFHDKKGISGWYDYASEYGYYELESVIAWQPLPEPYRTE